MNRLLTILLLFIFSNLATANEETSTTIFPYKSKEKCFLLKAGEKVSFSFNANLAVNFNLHFHQGKQVNYPIKYQMVKTLFKDYTSESENTYCLMWKNSKSHKIQLTYQIKIL